MVNKLVVRLAISGGGGTLRGGWLISHKIKRYIHQKGWS